MNRILAGTPERSNGALTVIALVIEVGVPRNALTRCHTDLKDEFYQRIRDRGADNGDEAREAQRSQAGLGGLRRDRPDVVVFRDELLALAELVAPAPRRVRRDPYRPRGRPAPGRPATNPPPGAR